MMKCDWVFDVRCFDPVVTYVVILFDLSYLFIKIYLPSKS